MAGEGVTATVKGLPDLRAALAGIAPKLRRQALRNALAAGARLVRDEARRIAPVLSAPSPFRSPGTLRKAISVRTSKQARRRGDVGVFVNVRPAKKGQRGARSRTDPYYWRFVEFGTRHIRARQFLQGAARTLDRALEVFKAKIAPQIQRLNGGKDVQL